MNGSRTRTRRRRLLAFVVAGAATVAGLAVASPTYAAEAPDNTCPEVEIIGARGSIQPPGLGIILTPLAEQITQQLPQTVRATALNYPATLFNYTASVRQGVAEIQRVMAATAAQCADTRFVLVGYSQGADVMGDALVGDGFGGSSTLTATSPPESPPCCSSATRRSPLASRSTSPMARPPASSPAEQAS